MSTVACTRLVARTSSLPTLMQMCCCCKWAFLLSACNLVAHTDGSCIAVDYYYHVEGYSGPPSWEIFWVFGKIVGGGCNSDASSSCCRDFGCSVDGD